ncbi:GGDEF domain-containing protein [Haloimpatiens massiliensis]|uniref:GGDEF domain-containing protein n=1 Tax=Haloimpatiens massiliensis TaxID=1658110 RepID=UPI000C8200C3|nr:GGDEF domain-containing protein [Haloimpatiens massiliensis]
MNEEAKNIDMFFLLLFLIIFLTTSFLYINFTKSILLDFIMLALVFLVAIIAYFKGIIGGLLSSIVVIFFYASYILYSSIILGKSVEILTYFWMISIPLSGFISGKLSYNINQMQSINNKLRMQYKELITIDKNTGLSNLKAFYMDLDRTISRVKRHNTTLSLMIIKVSYFQQLSGFLGESKMAELMKEISKCVMDSTRNEDIRYKLSKDTLAILMEDTDIKGAEVVKERIKEKIRELNLQEKEKSKNINIEVKIGAHQYNKSIENSFQFKELTERELEYDVD